MFNRPKLNVRQARWLALINNFDLEIKYIKGKVNKVENALSIILQVAHLAAMRTYKFNIKENIKEALVQDENFSHVKACLQQEPEEPLRNNYTLIDDDIFNFNDRWYVPRMGDLKELIMDEFQKILYSSHIGYHKMITSRKKMN